MTYPTWTLQDRIRKARDHAGLNQYALAEAIGVSTNSVNRWEKGDRNPTKESLEAISRATGVPLEWFHQEEPSEPHRQTSDDLSKAVIVEWSADGLIVKDV